MGDKFTVTAVWSGFPHRNQLNYGGKTPHLVSFLTGHGAEIKCQNLWEKVVLCSPEAATTFWNRRNNSSEEILFSSFSMLNIFCCKRGGIQG